MYEYEILCIYIKCYQERSLLESSSELGKFKFRFISKFSKKKILTANKMYIFSKLSHSAGYT